MDRKSNRQPPHIGLVASSLVQAGAEKQFVYIARALRDAGTDARVFYLGVGGDHESALRAHRVPVYNLGCPGRPLLILARLVRVFSGFRPELVLASQFGDVIHAGLAGRSFGATVTAGIRDNGDLRLYGRRAPYMLRLAHSLIANSESARCNLIAQRVHPRKIQLLANVIDLPEFDGAGSHDIPSFHDGGRTIALGIGRLDRNKRFDRLIHALALARKNSPELVGLIVGRDCGERRALESAAKALGLPPDGLTFLGPSNHVPAILARVDMLIHTSDSEGFPNVLLESMAARRPIIATPAGDAQAIIRNAGAGYAVDFDDHHGMAERMVHLAVRPGLRARLGENGRSYVERRHNFQNLAPRLLSIFGIPSHRCVSAGNQRDQGVSQAAGVSSGTRSSSSLQERASL